MRKRTTVAAGMLLATSVFVPAAWAQADAPDFDPTDPFAGVESAGDWLDRFVTEAPADPNDPFNNMTSGEWWRNTWNGQWTDAAASGQSFADFYETLQGDSHDSVIIESPYPYASAEEHWNAWREAADGGTEQTAETLPDWSGDWNGMARLATSGAAQVADVYAAVAADHQEQFAIALQAELEARHWWPADTCLPNGYMRDGWTARFFAVEPDYMVMMEDQPVNEYRITFTDGRGFTPDELAFPGWYGQSQGFWDGDELIVWVKDIIPWFGGHGLPEYSDQLQIIERWKRIGDELVADIVMYDPVAFAFPWHEVATYALRDDPFSPPATHNECVSTNNVYHDEFGDIADFGPNDPRWYDIFDPEPWNTVFERAESAKEAGDIPDAPNFLTLGDAE